MRVFISYASEDRVLAEQVDLALKGSGYETFFDRLSLPDGKDYIEQIFREIELADYFVFLISQSSVQPTKFTLTELKCARQKWAHPNGRVLPVRIGRVPFEEIPSYLKSVSILEPEGNVPAEVVLAIKALNTESKVEPSTQVQEKARVWPNAQIFLERSLQVTVNLGIAIALGFGAYALSSEGFSWLSVPVGGLAFWFFSNAFNFT